MNEDNTRYNSRRRQKIQESIRIALNCWVEFRLEWGRIYLNDYDALNYSNGSSEGSVLLKYSPSN